MLSYSEILVSVFVAGVVFGAISRALNVIGARRRG